ncbi:hypothetical protein BJ912DRAFT_623643 [Pholiota molesta]|nr:hypothetical protein BJ912DRAFT_623643 [Pholiota molesta]
MNANEFNPENNIATSVDVSSGNALGTLNDQGDRSSEWASSTLEALAPDTAKDHPANEPTADTQPSKFAMHGLYPRSNAPVETPGSVSQLVPGAFPPSTDLGTVPLPNEQQGKDTTTTAPDRDAQYVKDATTSAAETVRDYASRTGEAVGGYLPDNVAAYLPVSTENSRTVHTDGSASSPKENSDLAAGIDTKEHTVSVSASQPPSADENRTETMHEGLEGVRKDNHIPGKPKSPRKVTLVSRIRYVNGTRITRSRLG